MKMKIKGWKVQIPIKDEQGRPTDKYTLAEENLIMLLKYLISAQPMEQLPGGFKNFTVFSKVAQELELAEKKGALNMTPETHTFLKLIIDKNIPSTWGMNADVSSAITEFMTIDEVSK